MKKKSRIPTKNFQVSSERFYLATDRDPMTRRKRILVRGTSGRHISFSLNANLDENQCAQLGRLLDKAYEAGSQGMTQAFRLLLGIR